MQNQTKKKTLSNSTIILASVDGRYGRHIAYEDPSGSFVMNAFEKVLKRDGDMTIKEALEHIDADVNKTAKENGVRQDPTWKILGDPSAGNLNFKETLKSLHQMLIINPTYDLRSDGRGYAPLFGALQDLSQLLYHRKEFLGPACQITVVGVPTVYHYGNDVISFDDPNEDPTPELTKIMQYEGNIAVFVCGHGARGYKDGVLDEYLVIDGQPEDRRLYGIDVARMIVKRLEEKRGFLMYLPDLCFGDGFPGENDLKKAQAELDAAQSVVVARGGPGLSHSQIVQEIVNDQVQKATTAFAYYKMAGYKIGAMNGPVERQCNAMIEPLEEQAIQKLYPNGEHEGLCGYNRGSLPVDEDDFEYPVKPLAQIPPGFALACTHAVAPSAPIMTPEQATACPEVQGRGPPEDLNAFRVQLMAFANDLPNLVTRSYEMIEASSTWLFGAGMLSSILPWLIAAVLVVVGAALWLYLSYMANHAKSTLFPMLVMFVVTTTLPYLCDPIVLQKFFAVDNSICVGLVFTFVSFLVLLLSVASDWNKLTTKASAFFKAVTLLGKYSMLAKLALEMHLMDGGRAMQQTVHVQVGGVDSFVMYYPLMALAKNPLEHRCPVPMSNNKFMSLPRETNFTVLNKELDNNALADLTCDYGMYLERVHERAKHLSNIKCLFIDNGKYAIDLRDLHIDTKYLENLLRVNATGAYRSAALADMLGPMWTKNGDHFHIQLPSLQKKSQPTTIEYVAAPFLFAVEKLAGLSLWPFTPRAPLSREL